MKSRVNEMLGIEFPLLAFSHCRDVVAAVSAAGGFGVLGVSGFSPEVLEQELAWIDEHCGGAPYGIDILVPEHLEGNREGRGTSELRSRIPETHRAFVSSLLARYGVDEMESAQRLSESLSKLNEETAHDLMDVAFSHPIGLIANALGVPPASMLERAQREGVPVAALVGAREHAVRQAEAGVDLIVAQGYEAAGHTGEVGSMVLIPEVIAAVRAVGDVPVLAAGGIVTGRQMFAAMAMGAEGAWTGSVWLTTTEAETPAHTQRKMLEATSRDTVRATSRTGKYSRQLKSAWTEAWGADGAPVPLPMPLQSLLAEPALRRVDRAAAAGNEGARSLSTYWVGQGVGLMNTLKRTRDVVEEFMVEFATVLDEVQQLR